jgi:predicted porin
MMKTLREKMKKILFASSALVAVAAFAGQAQASDPIKLSVGGYMEQYVGAVSSEDSTPDRNGIQSDTEVHFTGETTLDNGIQIGAHIELEGESSSSQIDEQYLYINGGFGQVKLGAEDGAASDMAIQAPSAGGYGPNDGGMEDWANYGGPFGLIDTNNFLGDTQKATYYTPVLGGFRAGVSYAQDISSEGNDTDILTNSGGSAIDAGVEFRRSFSGVDLAVSATGQSRNTRNSPVADSGQSWTTGVNVGFGNWTVGGSYGHSDKEFNSSFSAASTTSTTPSVTTAASLSSFETSGFDAGVSYSMDAATVALTYAQMDIDAYSGNTTTGALTKGAEDTIRGLSLGMNYTLGAGVIWQSNVFWTDYDADTGSKGNDGDTYGVITGLHLSF